MRRLLLCLMLYAAMLLIPAKGWACSCSLSTQDELYRRATAVFTGEIIDGMGSTDCGSKKMLTRVDKVYKGKPAKEVYLLTQDACSGCGVYLNKGAKYLIYGFRAENGAYSVGACSGTRYLREGDERMKDNLAFLDERRQQVETLGDAITKNPKQERLLLKTMAEHEIYWHDDANAEDSLRRLIELQPDDTWAMTQLINALYRQKMAQEIWDLYESFKQDVRGRLRDEVAFAISFAALELGKDLGTWFEYRLKEALLKDKDFSNRKFRALSVEDSSLENANFSGTEFQHMSWRKSNAVRSNFSRVVAKRSFFEKANLFGANFSAAQLENMSATDTRFIEADFTGANLKKANISGSEFGRAKFDGADLTGAKIKNGSFWGADLKGAILKDVEFEGGEYDCDTKWPEGFDPSALKKMGKCDTAGRNMPRIDIPGYPESLKSTELEGKDFTGLKPDPHSQKRDRNRWRGKNLKRADFSESLFGGAEDFSYSDLSGAKFNWTSLQQASFYRSVLSGTDFSNAYLLGVTFREVKLENTKFDGAMMNGMGFTESQLDGVKLSGARFKGGIFESSAKGADFSKAQMQGASLINSDFTGANFSGADLTGMKVQQEPFYTTPERESLYYKPRPLYPVNFTRANFTGAKLAGADLRNADFTGAIFNDTDVSGAKYDCGTKWPEGFDAGKGGAILIGSACEGRPYAPPVFASLDLKGEDLSGTNLAGAKLGKADMRGARLQGADLSTATLDGADLTLAAFNCSTKWPAGFDPNAAGALLDTTTDEKCFAKYGTAKLGGKDLSGLNLFSAPFAKADLRGANLSKSSMGRADLFEADLSDADLRDTDMGMANITRAKLAGARANCNTDWPQGFDAAAAGVKFDEGTCAVKRREGPDLAVRMLLHDWRKPTREEDTLPPLVENGKMSWFRPDIRAGKKVENTVFKSTDLRRVLAFSTGINNVKFLDCDLTLSYFKNARLSDVDFAGSKLNKVDFTGASLTNVSFKGADISGADFTGARIEGSDWTGAIYDCKTKGAPLEPKACQ